MTADAPRMPVGREESRRVQQEMSNWALKWAGLMMSVMDT